MIPVKQCNNAQGNQKWPLDSFIPLTFSFFLQGIRHVDHFGFICRESVECGGCQFVCYVFQCANEALVRTADKMKTLFPSKEHSEQFLQNGQKNAFCSIFYFHQVRRKIQCYHLRYENNANIVIQNHKSQNAAMNRIQKYFESVNYDPSNSEANACGLFQTKFYMMGFMAVIKQNIQQAVLLLTFSYQSVSSKLLCVNVTFFIFRWMRSC